MPSSAAESPPRRLCTQEFDELCEAHEIAGEAKVSLARTMKRAITICERDHALQRTLPPRRILRDELDRILTALNRLEQAVRKRPDVYRYILERGLGERLAFLLTNEAFGRTTGEPIGPIGHRWLEMRDPLQALAAHARQARSNLVAERGIDVYIGLLHLLREPIARERMLRRSDRGGGQPRIYRNLILVELIDWNEASDGPGLGREQLLVLAENLLESVCIDSRGLEDAFEHVTGAMAPH